MLRENLTREMKCCIFALWNAFCRLYTLYCTYSVAVGKRIARLTYDIDQGAVEPSSQSEVECISNPKLSEIDTILKNDNPSSRARSELSRFFWCSSCWSWSFVKISELFKKAVIFIHYLVHLFYLQIIFICCLSRSQWIVNVTRKRFEFRWLVDTN